MASRIQGITVEIGGDTTKLSSALSGVNKEIKNTQSQLKDVEKLLKLDPTNTELLAQKQRLLGDAIKETKDKLDTLKTAASQANEQLQKGDITKEQYNGLQREIQETEQKLKSLEEQAAKTNTTLLKIDEVGGKLKDVGDKVSGVGKALMPVSAGVTALGTAAVKMTSDFDSGMSRVAAISGATDEELAKLRQTAKDLGASTAFSRPRPRPVWRTWQARALKLTRSLRPCPVCWTLPLPAGRIWQAARTSRRLPCAALAWTPAKLAMWRMSWPRTRRRPTRQWRIPVRR